MLYWPIRLRMDLEVLMLSKVHPELGGGAELRTWELAKRFADQGVEVTILTTWPSEMQGPSRTENVDFVYLPLSSIARSGSARLGFFLPRIQYFLSRSSVFRDLICDHRPDVVHFDLSPFYNIYSHSLCGSLNLPTIATIHNLRGSLGHWIESYGPMGIAGLFEERAIREGSVAFDRIISPSKWLRDSLLSDLPEHAVHWIPNGVDIVRFRPSEIKTDNDENGRFEILSVGRFVKLKGYETLIRSLARLINRGMKVHLTLVGSGPELAPSKELSRQLGIAESVSFIGRVPHEEMAQIYQQADAFVLPSFTEGMSLAVLEAMSSGLPIIATDIPANREVLGGAAIFVPPGNVSEFDNAIMKLVTDSEKRRSLALGTRNRAVGLFSWDLLAERELNLFLECIQD